MYYAYRPKGGRKVQRTDLPPRYFNTFDRLMVLVGILAVLAFVVMAVVTRGSIVLQLFQRIVSNS